MIEFARREMSRLMHRQGLSLEVIAARVESTPGEINQWMKEYNEAELRVRERLHPQFAGRCVKCGEVIPFNVQSVEVGSGAYHPMCWQKLN